MGINGFKKGYQPKANVAKDENGDMDAGHKGILNRCRKPFSQLLNIHQVNDVRQTEIHTAQPLVPEPCAFEFQMALKQRDTNHKAMIKIRQNLSKQAAGKFVLRYTSPLVLFGISRNCLSNAKSQSLCLFIRRLVKQTAVIIDAHHLC
jgi:hypothetical protein